MTRHIYVHLIHTVASFTSPVWYMYLFYQGLTDSLQNYQSNQMSTLVLQILSLTECYIITSQVLFSSFRSAGHHTEWKNTSSKYSLFFVFSTGTTKCLTLKKLMLTLGFLVYTQMKTPEFINKTNILII